MEDCKANEEEIVGGKGRKGEGADVVVVVEVVRRPELLYDFTSAAHCAARRTTTMRRSTSSSVATWPPFVCLYVCICG